MNSHSFFIYDVKYVHLAITRQKIELSFRLVAKNESKTLTVVFLGSPLTKLKLEKLGFSFTSEPKIRQEPLAMISKSEDVSTILLCIHELRLKWRLLLASKL